VFVRAVFAYHRRRARARGVPTSLTGSATATQFGGSFANANLHSTRSLPRASGTELLMVRCAFTRCRHPPTRTSSRSPAQPEPSRIQHPDHDAAGGARDAGALLQRHHARAATRRAAARPRRGTGRAEAVDLSAAVRGSAGPAACAGSSRAAASDAPSRTWRSSSRSSAAPPRALAAEMADRPSRSASYPGGGDRRAEDVSDAPARSRSPHVPPRPARRCTAPASRADCPGRPRSSWCTSRW
jgi:hypothetical protein